MKRTLALVLVCLSSLAVAAGTDQPRGFGAKDAHVFRASPGTALSGPATGSRAAIVQQFLRDRGVGAAAVNALQVVGETRSPAGVTHVRFEQVVDGLRVEGAYVKAAFDDRGRLIHVIEAIAPVSGKAVAARVGERQALGAALASVHPGVAAPAEASRQGNTTLFVRTDFFHAAPTVERVAIAMTSGALKTGFLVETWSEQRNQLRETLVSGEGRVLWSALRTADDSYNVFTEDPVKTPQTVVSGPGSSGVQSPSGWLFAGTQRSTSIAGNNAHAYLDTDDNNAADPGGANITSGDFVSVANLGETPSSATNQAVAVQNLFFLNNVIHDTLFAAGFNEAAGNFQETNFSGARGGSDSVDAEAQDGGGTDNANFATPRDGKNPRMQMYLWSGKGDHQVVVNSPASIAGTYRAQGTTWGGTLTTTGITGDLVLVNDGAGTTSDACEALPAGSLTGKLVLIDRGTCAFVDKVKNVEAAGAAVAIVANNQGDSIIVMGGDGTGITIPAIFIGLTDGNTIKSGLTAGPANATARKTDPPPLLRDGDVDSDIVWHEYGHGLTWRMIGRMDGPLAGAIGEGMSDVLSVIVNDDDVVGEYAYDDPLGIRTRPYGSYTRTYGSITGSEVHLDGEVYGAIGWRLWKNAGLSRDQLLGYLVDGMNYTPAQPAYEEMRDGILAATAGTGLECKVWEAFAHYGVGVGASGVARGSKVTITESFAMPSSCP